MKLEVKGIIESHYDKEVSWFLGTVYIMDLQGQREVEKWRAKKHSEYVQQQ